MFVKILYYCWIYILSAYGYQPLREGQYHNFAFDEIRWVTVRSHPYIDLHPCKLDVKDNWNGETHEDITDPNNLTIAVERLFLRYYIKKRLATNSRVQFVALLNPLAPPIHGNTPDQFQTQLRSIFCHGGIIEPIEKISRLFGQHIGLKCDIEEKLVALCLLDFNSGDLGMTTEMFDHFPNAQLDPVTTATTRGLVGGCWKFTAQKLPGNNDPFYGMNNVKDYLIGAKRAGFNRVVVHGYHVAEQCQQPDVISWSGLNIDWMLQNEQVMRNLFAKTFNNRSNRWLPGKVWYFCQYI